MEQARGYVNVLERINAVGMSVKRVYAIEKDEDRDNSESNCLRYSPCTVWRKVNRKKTEESEKKDVPAATTSVEPAHFQRRVIDLPSKREDLKWLYGEVCSSWRMLTDVASNCSALFQPCQSLF